MLEHRFAQLAAACTFLLLIIGGTVNPTGSSLACPEPTLVCHGQVFPEMTGGVFYEHGHRLAAMTVGLLQIGLTVLLLRRRRGMRALAWTTLAMVCLQGALGAITVQYKLPWFISTAHLMLGFVYFATLLYVAWLTRTRREPAVDHQARIEAIGPARRWIVIALGAVAVQILLGGLVRHSEATLACIGMPWCTAGGQGGQGGQGGEWFPTAMVQRLHMIHRGFGVLTGVLTVIAAIQVWRAAAGWPALRRMMIAAPVLVATQIVLGIYVVLTFRQVPVAVAHFAGAVSLWGVWVSAWFMTSWRIAHHRAAVEDAHMLSPVRGVHAVP